MVASFQRRHDFAADLLDDRTTRGKRAPGIFTVGRGNFPLEDDPLALPLGGGVGDRGG